ncbi:uncharacterized protein LOC131216134 [Anopheles bellator]|uniref:uncharacterized protein LOC131216134 n=1 Tax=Anopheles bellator TaxID=139047 RepID=UPI0026477715|nr:uncharacterized protein LOC131216134 [Anopheles bellator]
MSQIEKRERILQIIATAGPTEEGTQPTSVPPRNNNSVVRRTKLDVPQNIIEKPNCGDLYSCGYCQYRGCTSKIQLSKHILRCEDSNDLVYPCAHCSKVLDRSRNFEQIFEHLFYHGERLYRCSRCSFMHYRRAEVTKHLETVHAGTVVVVRESSTTWSCNMCAERSPYRQAMMDHFYQTHLLPGERYMCTLCDKSYFDDKFFVSHFQQEHPGEKLLLMEMYKPVKAVGAGSRSEPMPITKYDASKQQRVKVKVDSLVKNLVSEPRSDGQPAVTETCIEDLKTKDHPEPAASCTKKDAEKSTAATGENKQKANPKGPRDEPQEGVPLAELLLSSGYSVTKITSFQSLNGTYADKGKALPSTSKLKNPKSLQPEQKPVEERERGKRKQKLELMEMYKPVETDPVKEPRSGEQPAATETSINDLKTKNHKESAAPCTKKDTEEWVAATKENERNVSAKEPYDDVPLAVLLSLSGYSVTKIASHQSPNDADTDNGMALPSSSELKNPKSLQPELLETEPKPAPSLDDSAKQNVAPAEASISTVDSDIKHKSVLHQESGDPIALAPSPCSSVNRRISRRVALKHDVSHQWSDCTRFCCYHCNLNVGTFEAVKAHKCRAFAEGGPKSGPLLWKFLAEKETPRAFRLVTLLRCFFCSELGSYSELAEHVRAKHADKSLMCIDYWNSFKCGLCTYLNGSGDEREFSEHYTRQHAACNTDFNPDFPLNDEFLSWALAFGALPDAPKNVDIVRFMCHLCHVHSASETTLGEHMAQHLFSFVCPDCQTGFRELKVLYEHVITVHARNELVVAKNFEFSKCYDLLLDFQAVFSNGLIMSKRHLMATSVSPSIEKLYTGIQRAYTRQCVALNDYKANLQLPLFDRDPETCEMFLKKQMFYPRPTLERLDGCGSEHSKRVAHNGDGGESSLNHKRRRLSNGSSSSYEYDSD